jgi:hypothetical protein
MVAELASPIVRQPWLFNTDELAWPLGDVSLLV